MTSKIIISRIEWAFSNLNYAYVQNYYGLNTVPAV